MMLIAVIAPELVVGFAARQFFASRWLKARISDDAIQLGITLIRSGTMFCTLFDNINIFLRKSQQRITNRNSMIHATNVALIAIPDLEARLAMRGLRAAAIVDNILPTNKNDSHMELSFQALVAEIIILYCPDSNAWKDRTKMLKDVDTMMPKDRSMEVHKTDARPFGVFDVNEGSKKGIIDLFDGIRERSTLTKTQWAAKTRIVQGDWLSTNNYHNARRIRRDDVDAFERMDYGEDLTALFHHALQASHSIMRIHYGHAVRDPMSLAAHKGLLHRTWDVKKPNYAASKSLICHSLIALEETTSVSSCRCGRATSAERNLLLPPFYVAPFSTKLAVPEGPLCQPSERVEASIVVRSPQSQHWRGRVRIIGVN
ncbi:hypothetical protein C8J57DRAFT_1244885 [Mycena rebaudengoi]|nr:hypothetical protein C8J57DRAFT_1244885 [Mycena rebaudengoi]